MKSVAPVPPVKVPFGVDTVIPIDGLPLNVRQDGTPGDPTVVLIHAFAGSLHQWDDVAQMLSKDHWIIRLDLAGHGDSAKPESGYSMPDQARRVVAVAEYLGAHTFVAVGQSGGGNVVVAMLEDPALRAYVRCGSIIGTPPNMSFVNLPALANVYSLPVIGKLMWKVTNRTMVSKTMKALFAPTATEVPAIVVDDFLKMTQHSYVSAKQNLETFATTKSLSDRVTNVGVPLHVVFGDADQWIPPACTKVWSTVGGVSTELLPGVGHTPPLEDPSAVASMIRKLVRETHHQSELVAEIPD